MLYLWVLDVSYEIFIDRKCEFDIMDIYIKFKKVKNGFLVGLCDVLDKMFKEWNVCVFIIDEVLYLFRFLNYVVVMDILKFVVDLNLMIKLLFLGLYDIVGLMIEYGVVVCCSEIIYYWWYYFKDMKGVVRFKDVVVWF